MKMRTAFQRLPIVKQSEENPSQESGPNSSTFVPRPAAYRPSTALHLLGRPDQLGTLRAARFVFSGGALRIDVMMLN